jgi:phage shock protein A
VGLLLVGLALCLLALAYESHRAGQLEERVEKLSGALSEAEATVAAHREHLGAIQERVSELRTRFEALETMVEQAPAPGRPPRSAED